MFSIISIMHILLSTYFDFTGKIPDGISNLPALSGIYLFNNCFDDREASVQTFNENMHENSYIFI